MRSWLQSVPVLRVRKDILGLLLVPPGREMPLLPNRGSSQLVTWKKQTNFFIRANEFSLGRNINGGDCPLNGHMLRSSFAFPHLGWENSRRGVVDFGRLAGLGGGGIISFSRLDLLSGFSLSSGTTSEAAWIGNASPFSSSIGRDPFFWGCCASFWCPVLLASASSRSRVFFVISNGLSIFDAFNVPMLVVSCSQKPGASSNPVNSHYWYTSSTDISITNNWIHLVTVKRPLPPHLVWCW